MDVALDLVAETVGRLESEFGRKQELKRQLGFQLEHDRTDFGGQHLRYLTFLDGVLG